MAQPERNSMFDFVNRLITDEAYAKEIKELVENVLRGRGTVDELRGRVAIDPKALRAMVPQKDENLYTDSYKTTSTSVTTASLTSLGAAATLAATHLLDVEADGPVE